MNITFASQVLREIVKAGVREFCICAGARNAPIVEAIKSVSGITAHSFFDERSAAFFGLGCTRRTGGPTCVITTSGTAVAELLPATIEAFYSNLPLVLLTADRPSCYRHSGAPQAIQQVGLFSHYVSNSYDWSSSSDVSQLRLNGGNTHINLCFDEPLMSGKAEGFSAGDFTDSDSAKVLSLEASEQSRVEKFLSSHSKPLILLGGLPVGLRPQVAEVIKSWKRPFYAEAVSGLREESSLETWRIKSGPEMVSAFAKAGDFDSVIRIGSVPTLRFWRDLENHHSHLPVLSISQNKFSGLSRDECSSISLNGFLQHEWKVDFEGGANTIERDRSCWRLIQQLATKYPQAEPVLVNLLSDEIEPNAQVFLGNSLPIREWDLMATHEFKNLKVSANRGANGIDGLVSSFLGESSQKGPNWAIIGDLSALYDLSGLWPVSQMAEKDLRLVVINNGGGKIFTRVFNDPSFENQHQINFKGWADLFDIRYCKTSTLQNVEWGSGPVIVELCPYSQQTTEFWQEYDQLWQ